MSVKINLTHVQLLGSNGVSTAATREIACAAAKCMNTRSSLISVLEVEQLSPYQLHGTRSKAAKFAVEDIFEAARWAEVNGFVQPVIIGRKSQLGLDDELRVIAAKLLDLTSIPCIRLNRLTYAEERLLTEALKHVAKQKNWSFAELHAEIRKLLKDEQFTAIPGFENLQIDQLSDFEELPEFHEQGVRAGPVDNSSGFTFSGASPTISVNKGEKKMSVRINGKGLSVQSPGFNNGNANHTCEVLETIPANEKLDEYEVGYKKPPRSGQFKKGQSGNPRGRPKAAKSMATLVADIFQNQKVEVTIKGKLKKRCYAEVAMLQLAREAALGKPKAIELMMKLLHQFGLAEPYELVGDETLDDNERAAIERLVEAFERSKALEGVDLHQEFGE